jgi:hypothetical protein
MSWLPVVFDTVVLKTTSLELPFFRKWSISPVCTADDASTRMR